MSGERGTGPRLDELESRVAFQDDLIESLNAVVARQDRELADLRRRVRALEDKLADLSEASSLPAAAPGHEVPPHY
jgi:SlyX protein